MPTPRGTENLTVNSRLGLSIPPQRPFLPCMYPGCTDQSTGNVVAVTGLHRTLSRPQCPILWKKNHYRFNLILKTVCFLPITSSLFLSVTKSLRSLMKEDTMISVGNVFPIFHRPQFTKIYIIDAGTFIVIPFKHRLIRIEKLKYTAGLEIQMYKCDDNPYESPNKARIGEKPPPHIINLVVNGREVSWDGKCRRITP